MKSSYVDKTRSPRKNFEHARKASIHETPTKETEDNPDFNLENFMKRLEVNTLVKSKILD